jgi:DNA repair exonuclease SbcCD ATPase subunit
VLPEDSQSQDVDLDRTDRLPILDGTSSDDDVADDAVHLDFSPVAKSVKSEFRRPSPADLPSLAESVRLVEERIARRNAEYDALTRSHEKARAAEAAAASRAAAMASELSAARALLGSEQARSREQGSALAAQSAAAELTQSRMEEAVREAERHLQETRTLRETVAARDAALAQVLHSLAERDAQLSALQREHAHVVPSLEERSTAAVQLEAALRTARARLESMTADLGKARQTVATLTAQLKRGDEEHQTTGRDLKRSRAEAAAYLERLRTREFRRALDESGAAPVDHRALLSERDELRRRVVDVGAQLAARDEALARLESSSAAEQATRAKRDAKVHELERARADLTEKLRAGNLEAQRGKEMLSGAEQSRADLALEVLRLRAEAQEREGQMEVLLAHLQEARRLIGQGGTPSSRPSGEPAARSRAMEQLSEENRSLRAALDRTRGALEEREFMLRRLERGESTDPNAVGRADPAAAVPPTAECAVDLIRIDGNHNEVHALGKRTRIGRAPGCELHIESSSVSRHHALVLTNSRDVIIEDQHSTNGVIVNGRKVTRQLLTDGDILTIGEAQFRLRIKPGPREPEAKESGTPPHAP